MRRLKHADTPEDVAKLARFVEREKGAAFALHVTGKEGVDVVKAAGDAGTARVVILAGRKGEAGALWLRAGAWRALVRPHVLVGALKALYKGNADDLVRRVAAALDNPLVSEYSHGDGTTVVLAHSTRVSGLRMGAIMDHKIDGPKGVQTEVRAFPDGGLVTAYDAKSGKPLYLQQRKLAAGQYWASPVAANGHIYFTSLDGVVTVLKAGAEKPEVVAQNPTLGERVGATPAIADNTLYIRTDGHLYAFAEKKE